jgi:hypothetical protein
MDWKTVLLPIAITLIASIVVQNKRIDDLRADMNRQFAGVSHRVDTIEGPSLVRNS